MAKIKKYRADNTRILSTDRTDNPKLGAKLLAGGKESLFLDFYLGFQTSTSSKSGKEYKRVNNKRVFLKLYLYSNPKTAIERQENKNTLELAKLLRFKQSQQLLEGTNGYSIKEENNNDFYKYYQSYIDSYTKKDKRTVQMSLRKFKNFTKSVPGYNKFQNQIKPNQLTKEMIEDFTDYLQNTCKGEGANSCFARFKKVLKYATEHGIFIKNPSDGVTVKIDRNVLKKDILSMDEIKTLMKTHYPDEKTEIKKAFLFSLYTGIRYCDIIALTFNNIDASNKLLRFTQKKTEKKSSNSGVVTPLSDDILTLIHNPVNNKDEKLFNLPGYKTCLTELKKWVEAASINKHITWHCARHSFAVNILNNGANIKTVAALLGHSGLLCTEKYTRAIDSLKEEAIKSLPTINISEEKD